MQESPSFSFDNPVKKLLQMGEDMGEHWCPSNMTLLIRSSRFELDLGRRGQVGRKVETGRCQNFYERWRDSSNSSKFLDSFPYKLELGVDDLGRSLLPFNNTLSATAGSVILVTKAYDYIFHRLLHLRQQDTGYEKGVVLTGQPGTGASLTSPPCAATHEASVHQEKLPS